MSIKFYPYLWYLSFIKKDYLLIFDEYNPYLILSSTYINDSTDLVFYINLSLISINFDEHMNKELIISYILILSKLQYIFFQSPISYITRNSEASTVIRKWEYKASYINDFMYIFKNCIKEIFPNNIIYRHKDTILVYLDYERNDKNESLIKIIIEKFMYFSIKTEYIFSHFYILNIEQLGELNEWELL
ncbi:hypothetical protein [Caviibacter abscessus]|uniref:hypothetical protein n=1 Tax=Caviibacter abscessus TaxID=1766719 RepID=UPI000838B034|nr:hypothetical protein [Caviibacter abscessus]